MKNILLFICFLSLMNSIDGQTKPVCDDVSELPQDLLFNFFVILDIEASQVGISFANQQIFKLEIVSDSVGGEVIYSKIQTESALSRSGFVSFKLNNVSGFQGLDQLFQHANDHIDAQYFANLYIRRNMQDVLVGTQLVHAVPYAQVASVLGGRGSQGEIGAEGAAGAQGPVGPQGATGAQGATGMDGTNGLPATFDFESELMIMTNVAPIDGVFYVDDGTNTGDGLPHLRYFINGIWIDL